MRLGRSRATWASQLMLMVLIQTSEEHRFTPIISITADSDNNARTMTCDAGILASQGTGPLLNITFTIDTQCGTIQGSAKDIAQQFNFSSFPTIEATDGSTLLVNTPLPDFLTGSNISCQVRQQKHLEVHQSAKIRLCLSHHRQVSIQEMCNGVPGFMSKGKESQDNDIDGNNRTTKEPGPTLTAPTDTTVTDTPTSAASVSATECSSNPTCNETTLVAMFAPIQALIIVLVITVLIAISGVFCYKKRQSYLRRKRSLSLRSVFIHEAHSPVISPFSVHLEEPGSLPFPSDGDNTPLQHADSRYTSTTTTSSISLQSRHSEVVLYV